MKTSTSTILIALLASGALSAPATHQNPGSFMVRRDLQNKKDLTEALGDAAKNEDGLLGKVLKGLIPLVGNLVDKVSDLTKRIGNNVDNKDLLPEVLGGVTDLLSKKTEGEKAKKHMVKDYAEELATKSHHHHHHHQPTHTKKYHQTSTSSGDPEATNVDDEDSPKPHSHRAKKAKDDDDDDDDDDNTNSRRSIMMEDEDLFKRAESLESSDASKIGKLLSKIKKGKDKKEKENKTSDESDHEGKGKHSHKKGGDDSKRGRKHKHDQSDESEDTSSDALSGDLEKRSEMAPGSLRDFLARALALFDEEHSKTIKPVLATPTTDATLTRTPTSIETLTTSTRTAQLTTHKPTLTHTTHHHEPTRAIDNKEIDDDSVDDDDEEEVNEVKPNEKPSCNHDHDHTVHEVMNRNHPKQNNGTRRVVTEGARR
ncbi:hypothetical protein GQ602_005968 [Ophiocordyceps camponoti-floridani]|uniref:Uncharacterized protein n=1 Tax=Ophiocordyceps camponoti-floridani TaxID=2030778 RepID=A0A8H4Q2C5_9HYPO|nr:hypothetical protein GQ602_005968 [Ophiocordyceps camponoti-floridani]